MVIQQRRSVVGPLIAVLLVAAVVVAAIVVFAGNNGSTAAEKDVSVQACSADPAGGRPTAKGQIVNHSSHASNYVIRLKFTDAQGNELSEGVSAVKDVEAGATSQWDLTGVRDAKGPVKCEMTDVSRTRILPGQ